MATQLTVRIPDDLDAALDEAAQRSRLKRSDVVRAALRRFLLDEAPERVDRPIDLVRDLIGQARVRRSRSSSRRALTERIRKHAVRSP
jgi:Arc/MetJ-type ribon-helix-helix transcriptional regulator